MFFRCSQNEGQTRQIKDQTPSISWSEFC